MSAPKLTPDLEVLFQTERASEPLPDGFGEKLRARIDQSIGPVGPGGDGDGGDGGGEGGENGPGDTGPGDGGPGSVGGDALQSAAGTAGAAATGLNVLQVGSLLGVFGLGITVGAFGHAYIQDEPMMQVQPPIEPTESLAEVVLPVIPEPPREPLPEPTIEVEPAFEVPEHDTRPTPPSPPLSARLDGRALLDQAQNALARGLAREALTALDEHRSSFRRGPLREERQALRVQALAASGQPDRAQQEAAIFLARYPSSLFRDVVQRAARSGP